MIQRHSYKKIVIVIIFLIFSASYPAAENNPGWWALYFTSPGAVLKNADTPEAALAGLIASAKKSFYGAFFDLSSAKIAGELAAAKEKGVDVRLVTDSDNLAGREVGKLIKAGIPVVPDERPGLMHNKFAVIDEMIVWTGSYNLTDNCAHKNNNNAIMISSEEISSIYLNEFNEMFKYRIFGNKKEPGVFSRFSKKYYVKIGDTDINVYFSPEDNIERIILKRIKKAKSSIAFMAFSFTSDSIGEEMIKQHKKGIKVRGIIEKIGSNTKFSEYTKMKLEGMDVRLDKNRYRMHHKVIVIDGQLVITGSYNFSESANSRNDENVLMINNSEIAGEYLKEFGRLCK